MISRLLATGVFLTAAHVAAAQSVPSIMKPKQAAQRAVAATNRQVVANSTVPADTAPAPRNGGAASTAAERTARAVQAVEEGTAPGGRVAGTDSAAGAAAIASASSKGSGAAFERETFAYERSGRRDPFLSLMSTSELRPLLSDLKLVGVTYDASARNSIAVLRDLGTKEQYRVRVGHSLGRMRVASIAPKAVVFTIEEFGYSRQETLALGDSNKERKQ